MGFDEGYQGDGGASAVAAGAGLSRTDKARNWLRLSRGSSSSDIFAAVKMAFEIYHLVAQNRVSRERIPNDSVSKAERRQKMMNLFQEAAQSV